MILPIVLVTIQGATPNAQRDLDNAALLWTDSCGVWIEVIADICIDAPDLVDIDQEDCGGATGHVVSVEEDSLFALGRDFGPDVVAYYIRGAISQFRGCAAHPGDRRGFWVADSATDWTFVHELTHVVGDNAHETGSDNLMYGSTAGITNLPPDLTESQCQKILSDPALLCISSIVLNL